MSRKKRKSDRRLSLATLVNQQIEEEPDPPPLNAGFVKPRLVRRSESDAREASLAARVLKLVISGARCDWLFQRTL